MLEACRARFGPRFTLKFSRGRRWVFLADPADVKGVFSGDPEVFLSGRANEGMRPFFGGDSLFVIDGAQHRRHRRFLVPPFRGERLDAFTGVMRDLTLRSIAAWPVGEPFSIMARAREIALDIIIASIFGVIEPTRVARLRKSIHALTEGAGPKLVFFPPLRIDLGPMSPWGSFLRTRGEFGAVLREELDELRSTSRGREDIVARLMDEGRAGVEPLTDDELVVELLTLLGAGHETTTSAVSWAMQWILGSPEIHARVLEEIRSTASPETGVGRLPYLAAVVAETLRLTPPVPIVARHLAEDVTLGDMRLPADPEEFRPERFLGKRPSPFEYFPYGGGARLCVGAPFANHEIAVVVATMLTATDLTLVSSPRQRLVRHGMTLMPDDGTRVQMKRRAG